MRFNRRNWNKYFDGSNKKTTLRLKKSKIGHHKAYAGSYMKPEVLGEFDIIDITFLTFRELTDEVALLDGFKTLEELKLELTRLNGVIEDKTILYQHWTENVKQCTKN